jgi:hypothetical protein
MVAAGMVAGCMVAGCGGSSNSSTGSGGSGGTSSGSGGAGPAYGTSDCGKCVEGMACLSQKNACAADPSCAAYLDCLNGCPLGPNGDADPACEKACPAVSGTAGTTAKDALSECRTSGDGASCAACGQIPQPQNPIFHQMCAKSMESNKCYICEDEHCCDGYQNCLADKDCQDLQMCFQACPKADFYACSYKCYQDFPKGFPRFSEKLTCIAHFCGDTDACGDAPEGSCVKCQNLHCADETAACDTDYQCALLQSCQLPCNPADKACFDACEKKYPDGVAKLKTMLDCGLNYCSIVCAGSSP